MRLQLLKFAELRQTHFDVMYEYYIANKDRLPFYYRHISDILEVFDEREIDCGVAIVSSIKNNMASIIPFYDDGPSGRVPICDVLDGTTSCSEHVDVCSFIKSRFSQHRSLFVSRSQCFRNKQNRVINVDLDSLGDISLAGCIIGPERLGLNKAFKPKASTRLEEAFTLFSMGTQLSVLKPGQLVFAEDDSKFDLYLKDYLDFKIVQKLWNGCLLGPKSRVFLLCRKSTDTGELAYSIFCQLGDESLVEVASSIHIAYDVIFTNFYITMILDACKKDGVKHVYLHPRGLGKFLSWGLQPQVNIQTEIGSSFV